LAATASTGTWTCPGCQRRVPRREPRCHCGAARLVLTASPEDASGGRNAAGVAVLVLILAASCIALAGWLRAGRAPLPRQQAPAAARPRPELFPPLPPLPALPE
jgi:hypothetical protein